MEITMGLECRPIQAFWEFEIEGKCLSMVTFTYFTTISNMLFDMWIWVLPVRVIYKLQISQSRKIGLSLLFSIGLA